jgi:hypothetical protein
MTLQYKWPRENLNEYKFDARWPNDAKPSDIVVPFVTWIQENQYRIAQRNRHIEIAAAEKRDRQRAFDWNFQKGLVPPFPKDVKFGCTFLKGAKN